MSRHVSLRDQFNNAIQLLKNSVTRINVKSGIPLASWTEKKIALDHAEKDRVANNRKPRTVKRGNIYYAYLGKNIGSEQGGYRPVVVVQRKKNNVTSPTVIIVPLTDAYDNNGNAKYVYDTQHLVSQVKNPFLSKDSIAKTEYVRSISKNRLIDFIGSLDKTDLDEIDKCLKTSLSLT